MKNWLVEEGPGRLRGPRNETHVWLPLLAGVMIAAVLLLASAVRAQEEPPDDSEVPPDSGIEEVIVRGGESEATKDFETADSVTGFGAEDLAALGAQDISDIAAFTPNLEIVTSGATTPTFFIRGVGLNDFNSNSTGAVAIYQDDVARNAPALQLPTLFDVEAVNVLRGPQGTGLARNASAGAIKIYSRKPSGEFGAFLKTEVGNLGYIDVEGAVEAPIFEDILSSRLAFRLTKRDGTMTNRCGNAAPFPGPGAVNPRERVPLVGGPDGLAAQGKTSTDAPWSICGEPVAQRSNIDPTSGFSTIAEGLPDKLNDVNNWAARATVLFQPTLDMTWLLNGHGSRRDEWSRVGQSIGTTGTFCPNPDLQDCDIPGNPNSGDGSAGVVGLLGGPNRDASGYQAREVKDRLHELAPCSTPQPGRPFGDCRFVPGGLVSENEAKVELAKELAQNLDSEPWVGDFNLCSDKQVNGEFVFRDPTGTRCDPDSGRTRNDTYGAYLKGDIVLPGGVFLTTVSSYDAYNRLIDVDLDFSPETLFHIETRDSGWQATQDLRLEGVIGDQGAARWELGGWFLREELDVFVGNDLFGAPQPGFRAYVQNMWSAAGYLSVSVDFWENFTLDGGARYNWEQKKIDYRLVHGTGISFPDQHLDNDWSAPTGTARLTYRFRDDTHAYWKYSRGWKPGTYNASGSLVGGVTTTGPETIDAFETGMRGSYFDGRLGLEFSFFYYSYEDYQLFTARQLAGGSPEFVILNAPAAEVYGSEVDVVVRPWLGAFANVRFGWLESQFLDYSQLQQQRKPNDPSALVTQTLQNSGNALLNAPRFKVSLTGEQTFPLGRWGSVTARYDGVWTDVTYYDAREGRGSPNALEQQFLPKDAIAQPDYWLHNVRASYQTPGGLVEIAGWVRNLTDQSYKTFGFDASAFARTSIYFVGDPRTYGGTLTINF